MGIDPIASDVIKNLARPGGNVTGLSSQQSDLAGKRLELLREVVPIRRLAIIADVANAQAALEMSEVQVLARKLGIEAAPLEIRRTEDIAPALKRSLTGTSQPDALYIVVSALVAVNRPRIMTFALTARLPTIASIREFSQAGGLMSYGPNYSDQFRRAAELVDKVLRGTKPGHIPVEQPTKFDFVINLITANALGLDIPPTLLALADEVIE
jgi:putative ABC transport system substrate-binding protein